MQENMTAESAVTADEYDEEVHDVLIAISVVAKRLAIKMDEKKKSKEKNDVQRLRTDGTDRQGQKEADG